MPTNKEQKNKKKPSTLSAIVTGCIAGGIEAICVWPMEFMKTQLQLQSRIPGAKPLPFNGVYSGIIYTARTTGFFSLYNGLGITLLFSMPKAGIRFGANSKCKKMMADEEGKLTMGKNFMAGVIAGVVESIFAVTPMESIKTVTIEKNLGLIPSIRYIAKEMGPSGFYKGVMATMLKQASNQGLRFMFFNKYKDFVSDGKSDNLSPHMALVGGMMAGCFSTCLNNPFDMVKTRMQGTESTRYSSTLDCFRQVLKNEGVGALYAGVVPRLGRVVPGQGIVFMSFETVQGLVQDLID